MLSKKLITNYILINMPIAVLILHLLLLAISSITGFKLQAIFLYPVAQLIFIVYSCFIVLLFIIHYLKAFSILSQLNKYLKNEKLKKSLTTLDSWIPGGIKLTISAAGLGMFWKLINNVQSYYDSKIINYLNEVGSKVSAIEQKIVFEVVSITGFDFMNFHYSIMYVFNSLRDYYWITVAFTLFLLFKKNPIKLKILLLLNTVVFIPYVLSMPYVQSKGLLLTELKKNSNPEATVKYPLLTKLLKQDTFKIEIKDEKTKLEKIKLGRVSYYPEEDINIIHGDSLYCSLRNYNFSKSNRAPIELFAQDAGFIKTVEYPIVKIQYKGFLENIYDLEITNQYDKIKINNTYLEYDGETLYFKKIDSESSKKNTGVSIKCRDYLYSLYYDNNKVGVEKFNTLLTTGTDILFRNSYRGSNINELNPYKCDQLKRLNINIYVPQFGSKDFQRYLRHSTCIGSSSSQEYENNNDYQKIEYDNRK